MMFIYIIFEESLLAKKKLDRQKLLRQSNRILFNLWRHDIEAYLAKIGVDDHKNLNRIGEQWILYQIVNNIDGIDSI